MQHKIPPDLTKVTMAYYGPDVIEPFLQPQQNAELMKGSVKFVSPYIRYPETMRREAVAFKLAVV